VEFSVEAGERYLASGGPTSRIEEMIDEAGAAHGVHMETFATPTGIFISGAGRGDGQAITLLGRIKGSSTDLSELIRIERVIEALTKKQIGVKDAMEEMARPQPPHVQRRNEWVSYLSFFVLGAAASFVNYGALTSALISGLLCFAVGFLSGPLRQRWGWSGIFTDFLGTFGALVASGLISLKLDRPADSFAIGTLILLVPGLSLTNAITELAEQNFVSGTAKMMKSVLILLALGTAFLLVSDLSQLLFPGVDYNRWGLVKEQPFYVQILGQSAVIVAFTGVFRSPYRYIPFTLVPGLLSWYVLHKLNYADFLVLSSFAPALTVGFISLVLSRWLKVPSQIFSVPGILSLVPGMLALSSFYSVTDPSGAGGGAVFFQVAIVSSSIVFGLLTARVPFSFFKEKQKL
jgi:uncharacterized membrane protein YjjP (DUF1212 family)